MPRSTRDDLEAMTLDEDDDEALAPLPPPPTRTPRGSGRKRAGSVPAAQAAVETYENSFKAAAKREKQQRMLMNDTEFWVAVCFETRAQKEAFLERTGLIGLGDKHIDGIEAARLLGIPFSKDERVKWPNHRAKSTLAAIAGEDDEAQ